MPSKALSRPVDLERHEELAQLLSSYATKLNRLANDARGLSDSIAASRKADDDLVIRAKGGEAQALLFRISHLSSAAQDAARRASALIEHSVTDEFEKMGLKLRLADLESSAHYAMQIANSVSDFAIRAAKH
jgi:hypothetical protein